MSSPNIHVQRPVRRTGIKARARYSAYKGELRTDFNYACGYCGTSDCYSGGRAGFHIDHFAPKSKFGTLRNEYSNLVYSCPICNIGKSDDWPSDDSSVSFKDDIGYIDPCSVEYDFHLARDMSGKIVYKTALGKYIYERMKLYLKRRQLCWLIDKMESQIRDLGRIIESNPDDIEGLKAFYLLTMKYVEYTGIVKRE